MPEKPEIAIDIISDVVCPWCIIGYRQLERAIATIGDRAHFTLRWHPFELAPGLAPEGIAIQDYMRARYNASPETSRANRARLVETGAALGIDFRFDENSRIYSSFNAHQLLHWAGLHDAQTALSLELFALYFTEQANIADPETLVSAAGRAGFDRDEARALLADQRYAAQVSGEMAYWRNENITGVPAYILASGFMIPGAQEAGTFVRIFEKLLERRAA